MIKADSRIWTSVCLVVCGVLLQGGILAGWWPLGWPQPWLTTAILTTAWWLPLNWHLVLSLSAGVGLDSLQGQTNFSTTQLVLGLVLLTSLIRLSRWRASRGQIQIALASWLILVPLVEWWQRGRGLPWTVGLLFVVEVVVGLAVWHWLVRRLGPPITTHQNRRYIE